MITTRRTTIFLDGKELLAKRVLLDFDVREDAVYGSVNDTKGNTSPVILDNIGIRSNGIVVYLLTPEEIKGV